MAKILDQFGNPIALSAIAEPQTSRVSALANTYIESQLGGLTPARAARILQAADQGDILAQHQLFDDMLDRDAHLECEFGKRKGALLTLDWSIEPPSNPTAAEKTLAAWVEEILRDVVDDLEDVILSMMDAVGHGFSPIELEWTRSGGEWLPKFLPRPQTWFRLSADRRALRLNDGSGDGAAPIPFGWIMHEHKKAKTGYLARMGICRVLVWPFVYKSYSVGDLAEFLETYGLPIILGKYFQGASPEEKSSLMRAVTALGHDARAIMPKEMELEIQKVTGSGDGTPHLAMIDWAERAQSKAILGQVLSAEAKATGMGSGVADLQGEVRQDIKRADARQIAGTLTRDLVYPLVALNKPGVDGLRRCPRWVFDLGEAEDLALYADALPKLAQGGARIPVSWVHEKLRIPEASEQEAVFGAPPVVPPPVEPQPLPGLAALKATVKDSQAAADPVAADIERLATAGQPQVDDLVAVVRGMVDSAESLGDLQARLLNAYGDLDAADLTHLMASAFALAELKGMDSVKTETTHRLEVAVAELKGMVALQAEATHRLETAEPVPQTVVHNHYITNEITVPEQPPAVVENTINLPEAVVNNTINVPEQAAPVVNVTADVTPPAVNITNITPPPAVTVTLPARKTETTVTRDYQGNITRATQIETDLEQPAT